MQIYLMGEGIMPSLFFFRKPPLPIVFETPNKKGNWGSMQKKHDEILTK